MRTGSAGTDGSSLGIYTLPSIEGTIAIPGNVGGMNWIGTHCVAPPWGRLAAVDLNTGEIRWETPLGRIPQLALFSKSWARRWVTTWWLSRCPELR